ALAAKYPDDLRLRVRVALLRLLAGDAERGVLDLERLAQERPEYGRIWEMLASALEESSDIFEAMEHLAQLSARDSRLAAARGPLARLYQRIGRADLAGAELDHALKERPDLEEARLARARLAASQGDRKRAA